MPTAAKMDVVVEQRMARLRHALEQLTEPERALLKKENIPEYIALEKCRSLHEDTMSSGRHILRRTMEKLMKKMGAALTSQFPELRDPKKRILSIARVLYYSDPGYWDESRFSDATRYLEDWEKGGLEEHLKFLLTPPA